jgi:2-dehydro-3-deoxygalactonokinase
VTDTVRTALIALDWGTTSARAYRIAGDGTVVEQRSAPLGILHVREGAFAPALHELLGDWTSIDAPRLACGMVGSRQGWIEAPYTPCPAELPALARAIVRAPGDEIAIVGGLAWRDEHGTPDVMRGEETQIAGLPDEALAGALVVQPGTHSKWTIVAHGTIAAFATYMTGELYAVLREHSILGRLMSPGAFDATAFARGVDAGLHAAPGALPHALFAARTLPLFGELSSSGAADYLSGLLIGSEIAHARAWADARGAAKLAWLVGEAALCARYEAALRQAGIATRHGPADASARGLWRLAGMAGMV